MQVKATLSNARISPQKCRLVADMVRGKPVGQALNILKFSPKKGAALIYKVLSSAIANAEHNAGADIDELSLSAIDIGEIRKPELDSQLVAEGIAQQIEKRVMFRRAMKRAVQNTMRSGALGIKIRSSGRLNGAEIARTEWYREGRIPLHTFRADIDYGLAEARTTYGIIGIKVWIFKGEVFKDSFDEAQGSADAAPSSDAQPAA